MPKNDDWYPWYTAHFRLDCRHLTYAQDGAYRRLLDEYYATSQPLPDNEVALAGIVGTSVEDWRVLATVILPFFHPQNGRLIHKRVEKELHARRMLRASRSAKARDAANRRWELDNETKKVMLQAYRKDARAMLGNATKKERKIREEPSPVSSVDERKKGPAEEESKPRLTVSPTLAAIVKAKRWDES